MGESKASGPHADVQNGVSVARQVKFETACIKIRF